MLYEPNQNSSTLNSWFCKKVIPSAVVSLSILSIHTMQKSCNLRTCDFLVNFGPAVQLKIPSFCQFENRPNFFCISSCESYKPKAAVLDQWLQDFWRNSNLETYDFLVNFGLYFRERFQKVESVPIIGIGTESDSDCGELDVFYWRQFGLPIPISNISNTRTSVSSCFQTLRTEVEKRGAAEFFNENSRCLET